MDVKLQPCIGYTLANLKKEKALWDIAWENGEGNHGAGEGDGLPS